jgi:mannose-6-phosphate isomerase
MSPRPQLLPVNQVEHFYLGGQRIAALRGGPGGPQCPEEWIASMTTMTSQRDRGHSRLAGGQRLADAVSADPTGWLGPDHVERYGASTELLVKLLDAGQRLPVHLHPDRAFARGHLGLPHGKTEAWIVLEAAQDAHVRLGFAETMRLSTVAAMVDAQDSVGLVASLRAVPVRPGDTVLVPAGLPHCIDAGILVLELQEPTDLSILLEWAGFRVDGAANGHLGLGFDVALRALRLDALADAELDSLVLRADQFAGTAVEGLLPAMADAYFRAHRVRAHQTGSAVPAGFAVALATGGPGRLVTESGDELALRRGDAAVVPWAAGRWWLEGAAEVIACRPPAPQELGTRAGDAGP